MIAAAPSPGTIATKLLVVTESSITNDRVSELTHYLREGDVLVLNDAATLPAALRATSASGSQVELRLLSEHEDGWAAFLLGAGDWHTPTEHRPDARVAVGDELTVSSTLKATITALTDRRLARVRFNVGGPALFAEIYALGQPVQYAHVGAPLDLWSVQTSYASRPWAVEMPSAGRPLGWELLFALRKKGVLLRTLTHAAGLSASGSEALDARLPLRERYEIPEATAKAVNTRHGRVIAVGTSVVRALESSALEQGIVSAGAATTTLRICAQTPLRVVDGLLTGLHDPTASHFELLQAFLPQSRLTEAYKIADNAGYHGHEFGDVSLLLRS